MTGGAPFSINLPLAECVVPPGIDGPVALRVTSNAQPLVNNVIDRATTQQVAGPAIIFIESQPEMLSQMTTTISPDKVSSIITGASATATSSAGAFLRMFDLGEVTADVGGEMLGGKLASDALKSVFDTQSDIFEDLYFGDAFFVDLSPEKIFLARVFVDHCVSLDREDKGSGEQKMEAAGIPVVTSFAFRIQDGYNTLVVADEEKQAVKQNEDEDEREEARLSKEFIVSEMLKLAVNLDYADEIGRRKIEKILLSLREIIREEDKNTHVMLLKYLKQLSHCHAFEFWSYTNRDLNSWLLQDTTDAAYSFNYFWTPRADNGGSLLPPPTHLPHTLSMGTCSPCSLSRKGSNRQCSALCISFDVLETVTMNHASTCIPPTFPTLFNRIYLDWESANNQTHKCHNQKAKRFHTFAEAHDYWKHWCQSLHDHKPHTTYRVKGMNKVFDTYDAALAAAASYIIPS
ncbi:hypothetical protein DFH09DRAFT_1454196 [Mycena vulgaris]|nr:hypothetical protein DFH09DRAFT_1454196 [Mycena vulgaris]